MAPPTNRNKFKPPRPGGRPTNASKSSISKSSKSKSRASTPPRRKSAPSARTYEISSDDDEEDGEDEGEDSASSPGVNTGRQRRQSISDEDNADESMESTKASPAPSNDLPPTMPPALLTKLLHHHFPSNQTQSGRSHKDRGSNVRISKDAMGVVGKYMETFVREAIARAAYERNEQLERREKEGKGREVGADVLEVRTFSGIFDSRLVTIWWNVVMIDENAQVEDLEKLAPQLLLDF